MKKNKKIMLGIGTIIATSVPIATIISCGEKSPEETVYKEKLEKFKSIILQTLKIENNEINIEKINQGLDEISKLFSSSYKVKLILDKKASVAEETTSKENILQEGDSLQIELETKKGAINIMPLLNSIKEGQGAPNLLNKSNILKNDTRISTGQKIISANHINLLLKIIKNVEHNVEKTDFSKLMSSSNQNITSSWNLKSIFSEFPREIDELIEIKGTNDKNQKIDLIKSGVEKFMNIFLLQYKLSKTDSSKFLDLVSTLVKG